MSGLNFFWGDDGKKSSIGGKPPLLFDIVFRRRSQPTVFRRSSAGRG
jgi:hypothetical protein